MKNKIKCDYSFYSKFKPLTLKHPIIEWAFHDIERWFDSQVSVIEDTALLEVSKGLIFTEVETRKKVYAVPTLIYPDVKNDDYFYDKAHITYTVSLNKSNYYTFEYNGHQYLLEYENYIPHYYLWD